jgi:hypothetical protein
VGLEADSTCSDNGGYDDGGPNSFAHRYSPFVDLWMLTCEGVDKTRG